MASSVVTRYGVTAAASGTRRLSWRQDTATAPGHCKCNRPIRRRRCEHSQRSRQPGQKNSGAALPTVIPSVAHIQDVGGRVLVTMEHATMCVQAALVTSARQPAQPCNAEMCTQARVLRRMQTINQLPNRSQHGRFCHGTHMDMPVPLQTRRQLHHTLQRQNQHQHQQQAGAGTVQQGGQDRGHKTKKFDFCQILKAPGCLRMTGLPKLTIGPEVALKQSVTVPQYPYRSRAGTSADESAVGPLHKPSLRPCDQTGIRLTTTALPTDKGLNRQIGVDVTSISSDLLAQPRRPRERLSL